MIQSSIEESVVTQSGDAFNLVSTQNSDSSFSLEGQDTLGIKTMKEPLTEGRPSEEKMGVRLWQNLIQQYLHEEELPIFSALKVSVHDWPWRSISAPFQLCLNETKDDIGQQTKYQPLVYRFERQAFDQAVKKASARLAEQRTKEESARKRLMERQRYKKAIAVEASSNRLRQTPALLMRYPMRRIIQTVKASYRWLRAIFLVRIPILTPPPWVTRLIRAPQSEAKKPSRYQRTTSSASGITTFGIALSLWATSISVGILIAAWYIHHRYGKNLSIR